MLGAIIGDVSGSYYEVLEVEYYRENHLPRPYGERIKILDKSVSLFTEYSSCTDDSILTCAIYDAIKNGESDYEKYLRLYGKKEMNLGKDLYGRNRFGKGFVDWLNGDYAGGSYGNGASMRVSPVGFCFDCLDRVKEEAIKSCVPSHNHPDALKACLAVAESIFLLQSGMTKGDVLAYVESNYYSLDFDLENLQRNYIFSSKSSNSVPQALFVFFQSDSFEDAIRKAISIGGDSDTIAAISGALAEAYYGVPEGLKQGVLPYFKDYMFDLLKDKYYAKGNKELVNKIVGNNSKVLL